MPESFTPNACHIFRNGDRGQAIAVAESKRANAGHAFRDSDRGQTSAVQESIRLNACHAEYLAEIGDRRRNRDVTFVLWLLCNNLCSIVFPIQFVSDIVNSSSVEYFHNLLELLPTGTTDSTHPADLLANKCIHHALANLRETYDIIILDGPEIDSCNETLIGGLADVTCFVCCPGKTSKAVIESLDKLKKDNNLPSSCIVLNQRG